MIREWIWALALWGFKAISEDQANFNAINDIGGACSVDTIRVRTISSYYNVIDPIPVKVTRETDRTAGEGKRFCSVDCHT